MPFKNKEDYNAYMREYLVKYRKRDHSHLLADYQLMRKLKDAEHEELLSLVRKLIEIANQPSLSDSEKIKQLKALPVSLNLALTLAQPKKQVEVPVE